MPKTAKILIVDDDHDYVETARMVLEGNDYQVVVAYSKDEAWDKIKTENPNLILLDVMMERLNDGFKICHELKHNPDYKDILVITISSVNQLSGFTFSPETDGEYFQADEFFEKPFKAEDLLNAIKRLLEK